MKFSKDRVKGKIERRLWKLLIEYCKERNGHLWCEVCKFTMADQTDHCFSASKCPKIRFDERNLTRLCGSCHTKKTYGIEGYEKIVDEVVRNREGEVSWGELKELAKHDALFKWDVVSLENLEKELIRKIQSVKI